MTPEQEEQVRRALAAAGRADRADRDGDRMPDDVADRLDAVLSELVHERARTRGGTAAGIDGGSDELAARRRRWPQQLVAAAVVAVVALGGGALALRSMQSGGSEDSAASGGAVAQRDTTGAEAAPSTGVRNGSQDQLATVPVPRLRTATLARDVRRVVASDAALSRAPASSPRASAPGTCTTPRLRHGAQPVAVRLDGRPATLVVGPVRNGSREAAVYSCDDVSAPVARVSVAAR